MAKAKAKTKSVEEIIAERKKEHGERAVIIDDNELDFDHPRISSGIIALDDILGGGFAKGRMVDVYGENGSGKTGLALKFLGQAQAHGKCVFVDLENAYDPNMARLNGVDTRELIVVQIETAEDVMSMIDDLVSSGEVAAIVVDSIAGMVPRAEMLGEVGDAHVGLVGRIISQALRITSKRYESDTIVMFLNQLRSNIGGFGNSPASTPTGGRAVKFYSSTRLKVARVEKIAGNGSEVLGQVVQVYSDKSRLSKPFQTARFEVLYDVGINNEGTLLDKALKAGLVKQGGAWFTDTETGQSIQGRLKFCEMLRENRDVYDRLLTGVQKL